LFVRLAAIVAGIGIAFALAEIIVRLAGLAPTSLYTYDSDLGWTLKPNTEGWQTQEGNACVRVNRDGFRGPDYSLAKPPGTLRIAVLGDSFTEAQQVAENQTFCEVAQARIQALMPLDVAATDGATSHFARAEVLNFGCDGYGTAQELIMLRDRVWRYAPDVVVLAVFTGNDIRNNSVVLEGDKCRPFYSFEGSDLVLDGPFEDSFWFRLNCMLRFESRHSQVLNLLGNTKSLWRQSIRRPPADGGQSGNPAIRAAAKRSEPGLDNTIYTPPTTQVWREAWRVTEAEIMMVRRDTEAHHARLLVVTLANGVQDDPDPILRQHYAHFVGASDLSYPDDRIRALGEREGFPVLNLAVPMQIYAQSHHQYLHGFPNTRPGIGHWNANGHRLAGDLIASRLVQLLREPPSR
jgi:hypothetical protein